MVGYGYMVVLTWPGKVLFIAHIIRRLIARHHKSHGVHFIHADYSLLSISPKKKLHIERCMRYILRVSNHEGTVIYLLVHAYNDHLRLF